MISLLLVKNELKDIDYCGSENKKTEIPWGKILMPSCRINLEYTVKNKSKQTPKLHIVGTKKKGNHQ